jgi:hypothetical protein
MFTGTITEFFYENPSGSFWDPETKTMSYVGDGSMKFIYTTADDLAAYTIAAISQPEAEQGGILRVESYRMNLMELIKEHEIVYGKNVKIQVRCLGSEADVDSQWAALRKSTPPTEFTKYIGFGYMKYMLQGTWNYEPVDCQRFGDIKQTPLREWLRAHPKF